jgi:hypothetical protein
MVNYCIDSGPARRHRMSLKYRDLKGVTPIQRAKVPDPAAVVRHHCYCEGVTVGTIAEQNVPIIPRKGHGPDTVHTELKTEGRIHIIVLAIRDSPSRQSHPPGLTLDFDTEQHLVAGLPVQIYADPHIAGLRQFVGQSDNKLRKPVEGGDLSDELNL